MNYWNDDTETEALPYVEQLVLQYKADNEVLMRQRDQLREALIAAAASLAAADSAYAKYARRHGACGKAEIDPFFSTRVSDFEKAAEQARAALKATEG